MVPRTSRAFACGACGAFDARLVDPQTLPPAVAAAEFETPPGVKKDVGLAEVDASVAWGGSMFDLLLEGAV